MTPRRRKSTPPQTASKQDVPSRIGRHIRELRMTRGLMLKETAEKADLTEGQLSGIENGRRWRRAFIQITKLARAIGVSPGELLDDSAKDVEI